MTYSVDLLIPLKLSETNCTGSEAINVSYTLTDGTVIVFPPTLRGMYQSEREKVSLNTKSKGYYVDLYSHYYDIINLTFSVLEEAQSN